MQITPVILCGGAGTRMWPASRRAYPKQFIDFGSGQSLFQDTLARVQGAPFGKPVIIGGQDHRFVIADQLMQMGLEADILLEPVARGSAAAICAGTLHAARDEATGAVLILAADHRIEPTEAFVENIKAAYPATLEHLITFGIVPDGPATGYGYIQPGNEIGDGSPVRKADQFHEKPDLDSAKKYMANGFLWNSGNFLFRPDVFLSEAKAHAPEIVAAAQMAVDRAQRDLDFVRLDHESFEQAPARSVDYAIMEHSSRIAVLAADIRWWDLGNWKSVHAASSCDDNGNAVIGAGHFHEAKGNLIYARDRTAAVVGLDNIALVCTPDAVLAASLHSSEGLKQFVQHLEQIDPDAVTNNLRVHRPWGDYQQIDRGHGYLVKRITVKPHRKLSLQSHEHRAEHWVVVSGTAIVTLDDRELRLEANQSIYVPLGSVHRLANPTDTDLRLIEVQTGEILDEEDITRYEDVYNRV